jgi:CRP/FNR family cyclic AMP-dependent transcriptional regulator
MNNIPLNDSAEVLATLPLFAGVSKRRLQKLVRRATRPHFAPGETILSAVEYGSHLYVIISGTVEVTSRPAVRMLGAGNYFGELSLIDGRPRLITAVALTDVELIELPQPSVLKLARAHTAFTLAIFRELTPRLRRLEAKGAG